MVSRISKIERISVLTKLVLQYSGRKNLIKHVGLAIDLSDALDYLERSGIEEKILSSGFMQSIPEHWKNRSNFLSIVMRHWPDILHELEKSDAHR
jgi:inactivated superfamily I helicase